MIATPSLTTRFTNAQFHADEHLLTWHPAGVFDEITASHVLEFLELAEKFEGEPFDRYTDVTHVSEHRIGLDFVVRLARQRCGYKGPPVKSAIRASTLESLAIAHMYAELLLGSRIQVRVFRTRASAADWLDVPKKLLLPPSDL
jgi:hypothetical protein